MLVNRLGARSFMFGDSFTAIDAVIDYILARRVEKRPHFFEDFPTLAKYAKAMVLRSSFQKAIAQ